MKYISELYLKLISSFNGQQRVDLTKALHLEKLLNTQIRYRLRPGATNCCDKPFLGMQKQIYVMMSSILNVGMCFYKVTDLWLSHTSVMPSKRFFPMIAISNMLTLRYKRHWFGFSGGEKHECSPANQLMWTQTWKALWVKMDSPSSATNNHQHWWALHREKVHTRTLEVSCDTLQPTVIVNFMAYWICLA